MVITEVTDGRERYWELMLDADPAREMVKKYLNHGFMLVATEADDTVGEIITVPISASVWEIKNLSIGASYQKEGYGTALVLSAVSRLPEGTELLVGTSDSGVEFYEKCGFHYFRTEPDFFTENYPEPIFENGAQCVDMIYLKRMV